MTLDKVLAGLGRFFIGAGLLVFMFIGYQLWGTNIAEARNQDRLQDEAASLFAEAPQTTTSSTTTITAAPGQTLPPTTATAPPATAAPIPTPTGRAVAVIRIPKIKLQKAVVEGTSVADLKKGPGHYSSTPLPGQPGNSAIAGHRTTYGAPFGGIGELQVGDEIDVTTRQGQFVYKVTGKQIVSPNDNRVLVNTKDTRLTLTTCHPKFSAAQRLIVTAALAPGVTPAPATPLPAPTTTATPATDPDEVDTTDPSTITTDAIPEPGAAPTETLDGDLAGESTNKTPAILWGIFAALVLFAVWGASRLFNRWAAYLLGGPIFLLVLFIFFENFARLLPASA